MHTHKQYIDSQNFTDRKRSTMQIMSGVAVICLLPCLWQKNAKDCLASPGAVPAAASNSLKNIHTVVQLYNPGSDLGISE